MSNSEKESVQYDRTCYSKATHQGHITKEKEKFNKTTSIKNETPNIYEDDNRFTRSKTKPFMKDHCFFCQSLDISKLHEIESLNTGNNIFIDNINFSYRRHIIYVKQISYKIK